MFTFTRTYVHTVCVVLLLALAPPASAQFRGGFRGRGPQIDIRFGNPWGFPGWGSPWGWGRGWSPGFVGPQFPTFPPWGWSGGFNPWQFQQFPPWWSPGFGPGFSPFGSQFEIDIRTGRRFRRW